VAVFIEQSFKTKIYWFCLFWNRIYIYVWNEVKIRFLLKLRKMGQCND